MAFPSHGAWVAETVLDVWLEPPNIAGTAPAYFGYPLGNFWVDAKITIEFHFLGYGYRPASPNARFYLHRPFQVGCGGHKTQWVGAVYGSGGSGVAF